MRLVTGLLIALAYGGVCFAQPKIDPKYQPVSVPPLPAGTVATPVALTRMGSQLRADQDIGTYWYGVVCVQPIRVAWKDVTQHMSNLRNVFRDELKSAGFRPDADSSDLFAGKESNTTDLEIGAMIKGADASYCENLLRISGRFRLDIEWQVYSNLRREVVATLETHETAQVSRSITSKSGARSIEQEAFAANVRALLANEQFRKIVTAPDPPSPTAVGTSEAIQLSGPRPVRVAMSDAVGSVAAIFAGDGFGSGVLISPDGYLLTDQHVVGGAGRVRVRWSDGFETTGEVVRSDKRRDVALIKTDPHGRQALAIRRASPPIGATVFAIGTPLDPKLQSTVTRGVISANRIVDGFSFIQSDVPVTHGNSGGPLLDESGQVIGLTDWGFQPAGEGNLNFFVPAGDALDFLKIKVAEIGPASPRPQEHAAAPAPAKHVHASHTAGRH